MNCMFLRTGWKQGKLVIKNWNTSNCSDFEGMFAWSAFYVDIECFNISNWHRDFYVEEGKTYVGWDGVYTLVVGEGFSMPYYIDSDGNHNYLCLEGYEGYNWTNVETGTNIPKDPNSFPSAGIWSCYPYMKAQAGGRLVHIKYT